MNDDVTIDSSDLVSDLAKAGHLRGLLADAEVKKTLLHEIRELGVPAPVHHVVYRMIVMAVGQSESFLGKSLASQLQARLDRTPALANLLQRLANLQHGAHSRDALKTAVLDGITDGRAVDVSAIQPDAATSLEVILALHNVQGFERVLNGVDAQTAEITETIQRDLQDLMRDMVGLVMDKWDRDAVDPAELGAFDRVKYNAGLDELVGREAEIDLLHDFAGDLSMAGRLFHFRWMLLTGPGGEGKTRLVYDFIRNELDRKVWDAGKMGVNDLKRFGNPAKWRPAQPTFIVVDYAQNAPEDINRMLTAFMQNAQHYDVPVRVLLLERRAEDSWLRRMIPENADRAGILQHAFGHGDETGRAIWPLLPDAIVRLMQGRFEQVGETPPDPETLIKAAHKVDSRVLRHENGILPLPRALFALAAAESLLNEMQQNRTATPSELAATLDQAKVLDGMIQREQDMRWTPATTSESELEKYRVALALATMVQGLDLNDLEDKDARFGPVARFLPDPPPDVKQGVVAAMGGQAPHLPGLEPDIMGEFFLLNVLKGLTEKQRQAFLHGAAPIQHPAPVITILRLLHDFPDRLDTLNIPDALANSPTEGVAQALALLATDWVVGSYKAGAPDRAWALMTALNTVQTQYPKNTEIAVEEAKAAVNITSHAGAAGDWGRVDDMLRRFDALRQRFDDNAQIAVAEAKAAVNITKHARAAGDWGRFDDMLLRFDALRQSFDDNTEIAVLEAEAAFNITNHAGAAGDWARVDDMLLRFDALRQGFDDNAEIAVLEAEAAFNTTNAALAAGDWGRVDDMLRRLDALRQRFDDNAEIAVVEASAAVNIIHDARAAGDWGRFDDMLLRLDTLRQSFDDNAEIAVREAMAAFNITNHAGAAGDWGRVDDMLLRFDALRQSFDDNAEIAVREARAAVNISNHAGAAGDWGRVESMLLRLATLRQRFPDNTEIAVVEAKVARHIASHAGAASVWGWVDKMLLRFDALRQTFEDNIEIAVLEAKAAVKITFDAGAVDGWAWVNDMLLRLDALRQSFPDNTEIAVAEAMAAVNITIHARGMGDWGRVQQMDQRLHAIANAFSPDLVLGERDGRSITVADEIAHVQQVLQQKP